LQGLRFWAAYPQGLKPIDVIGLNGTTEQTAEKDRICGESYGEHPSGAEATLILLDLYTG